MKPERDLYTCPKCIHHKFMDESGIHHHGMWVHRSKHRRHWRKNSNLINQSKENKLLGIPQDLLPDLIRRHKKVYEKSEKQATVDSQESDDQFYEPRSTNNCDE
ncbi:hypothetical protein O181_115891 [Austropuccinia psidii MF-1]|uniref:Uncharacterized protein n=1 Tax=Austropuccinia psidii MF-1 TaxID=1389203 RepID=A0A9Q3K9N8_9BASI|nr:hypothetical protein [Austropuccinia psidii MF-1]